MAFTTSRCNLRPFALADAVFMYHAPHASIGSAPRTPHTVGSGRISGHGTSHNQAFRKPLHLPPSFEHLTDVLDAEPVSFRRLTVAFSSELHSLFLLLEVLIFSLGLKVLSLTQS